MKYLIVISLVIISWTSDAQTHLGIHYNFGNSDMYRFNQLDGAGSHGSDQYLSYGVSFETSLTKLVNIELSINHAKHSRIYFSPAYNPDVEDSTYYNNKSLLTIPILTKIHFLKYFFVSPGLVLGFDNSNQEGFDNQSGIGMNLGIGFEYAFDFGVKVYASPYYRIYSLIPISDHKHPQHLSESGLSFGVMYQLSK